jgi:FTR1 family protein
MKRWLLLTLLVLLPVSASGNDSERGGLREWLVEARLGLQRVMNQAGSGDVVAARAEATRVYLDYYEVLEGWYGPGGAHAKEPLATRIADGEAAFHALLRASTPAELERQARDLDRALYEMNRLALRSGVPLYPARSAGHSTQTVSTSYRFVSPELTPWVQELDRSEAAYSEGRYNDALRFVERLYLEGFEPLESRLPGNVTGTIERLIHLQLRPGLKAESRSLAGDFASLRAELGRADEFLARGGSFWFGATNSFLILVREGLEAVLLVGALLAYLAASGASKRDRRRIWLGAAGGITASIATWILAITVIPISGASRELVEGITALVAVCVLLYVSHWLFQKTYIHDWKAYLRDHLGSALTRGSAAAMMGLSFAAVYREGFETVLFYQALLFDVGGRAVFAGFLPGVLVITAVGWAVIRAGVKLPLKRVFAVTNTILLYLAFVFLGKGVFNLQESGAFAAHPISWLPSHPALQQLLGFYPLVETILAQVVLAVLLTTAVIVYRLRAIRVKTDRPEQAVAA